MFFSDKPFERPLIDKRNFGEYFTLLHNLSQFKINKNHPLGYSEYYTNDPNCKDIKSYAIFRIGSTEIGQYNSIYIDYICFDFSDKESPDKKSPERTIKYTKRYTTKDIKKFTEIHIELETSPNENLRLLINLFEYIKYAITNWAHVCDYVIFIEGLLKFYENRRRLIAENPDTIIVRSNKAAIVFFHLKKHTKHIASFL